MIFSGLLATPPDCARGLHDQTLGLKEPGTTPKSPCQPSPTAARLRDNCVPFDPHTKLEMYTGDDPLKNIGIKMVSKIAKEMNYQTTFGMNVLMIRL